PELERRTPVTVTPQVQDRAVQSQVGSVNVPAPVGGFDGLRLSNLTTQYAPPDTVGDVGSSQYLQAVNGGLAVFSKTGVNLTGAIDDSSFWNGITGCEPGGTRGLTDPTVNYD